MFQLERFPAAHALFDLGGFGVALDGKAVRTPAKATLSVPSPALAEAVAGEWRAQGDEVVARPMPLMRLACSAIDRVAPQRTAVIEEIPGYGGAALACQWAGRQGGDSRASGVPAALWTPWPRW